MTLKEQKAAALKRAQDAAAKAKAEGRAMNDDEAAEFDTAIAEVERLNSQLAKAAGTDARFAKLAELAGGDGADGAGSDGDGDHVGPQGKSARTIGEHFVQHAKAALAAYGQRDKNSDSTRLNVATPEFKLATDVQVSPAAGAGLGPLVTQYDTTFVTAVRRRLYVADLCAQGTMTAAALTYFVEGAIEGAFTTVAENATKPQLHFADPTPVTEALKKIAGFIKESDEMIEDYPFLVSAINNRLLYNLALFEEDQLLNGNGTGTNIRGLLQRSGIQTLGVVGDPKAGNIDTIFKALTLVETGSGFFADGIVIHPTDYQTFRLSKDANGQYFAGGPFTGTYGVGGIMERPPLWGVRTVVTPAIAAGTVLVGAFQPSSEVLRKGGVRVEATNSNEADFINNRIAIRAEERLILAVRYPAALVKVTLGTT